MATFLIRQAHGGATREIDDSAWPFFRDQGWVVIDTLDETDVELYLTAEESNLRFAQVGDIGDDASPTGSELRTFFEQKINRTGATTGNVPVLQSDGTLAFGAGGGGGAVASVNSKTGTVVLNADDIADGLSSVIMTAAERAVLTLFNSLGLVVVFHSGGADPVRPATTAHVLWVVPDGNRPDTNGTTAGGSYAAVGPRHDLVLTY